MSCLSCMQGLCWQTCPAWRLYKCLATVLPQERARTSSHHCLSMMEALKLPWTFQGSPLLLVPTFRKVVGASKAPEWGGGCSVVLLPDPGLSHSPELGEYPHPALGYASHWLRGQLVGHTGQLECCKRMTCHSEDVQIQHLKEQTVNPVPGASTYA